MIAALFCGVFLLTTAQLNWTHQAHISQGLSATTHHEKCGLEKIGAGDRDLISPAARVGTPDHLVPVMEHVTVPVSFEANRGQFDEAVRFISRGFRQTLFLTKSEAILFVSVPLNERTDDRPRLRHSPASIRMGFEGANPSPDLVGTDEFPGRVNYFLGNDSKRWRTDIPTYGQVEYRDLYPGIDLVFRSTSPSSEKPGEARQWEYDFIVFPGADPESIVLVFQGAESMRVDRAGSLVLTGDAWKVINTAPFIYQEIEGQRTRIPGRYEVVGQRVQFEIKDYDPDLPLVIDPVALSYSTFLGGAGRDEIGDIAVDAAGNVFVTGSTSLPTDFPTTTGPFGSPTGETVFVAKLNPDGTSLVYSTFMGGNSNDIGFGIAVDQNGNAHVAGRTGSGGFPTTAGAFQESPSGVLGDAFVTKLNEAGNGLIYSTLLGGFTPEVAHDIALGSDGSAFVVGETGGSGFPVTEGAFQTSSNGGRTDGFVTKLNPTGTALTYSTLIGGSEFFGDTIQGVALDENDNAFVIGGTSADDFPVTQGAFQTTIAGGADIVVSKLNETGTDLVYSTYLGGAGNENAGRIAVDVAGNAYVTGRTFPCVGDGCAEFPTTAGALKTTAPVRTDAFVSKISADGSVLSYSTLLGADRDDEARDIAVDGQGRATVVGYTTSPGFPLTGDAVDTSCEPCSDSGVGGELFISQLNSNASALSFSTFLGGSGSEDNTSNAGIVLDDAGSIYVAGETFSNDLPVSQDAFQSANAGGLDVFVAKISLDANDTPPAAGDVSYFPLIGDGVAGDILFQTSLIFVNTGEAADLQIEFLNSDGPISLTLDTSRSGPSTRNSSGSTFQRSLESGESISLQTAGTGDVSTGDLLVGYAKVTTGSGVGGTAVFARSHAPTGVTLYEAGVSAAPPLSEFSLFLDSLGNRDTGLAIVNPPVDLTAPTRTGSAGVTIRLYNDEFALIGTRSLSLDAGAQLSQFIWEIFQDDPDIASQAQEMEGVVTVHSDVPLVAVTLRQNDDPTQGFPDEVPTLTTFPVIPGTADSSLEAALSAGRRR